MTLPRIIAFTTVSISQRYTVLPLPRVDVTPRSLALVRVLLYRAHALRHKEGVR